MMSADTRTIHLTTTGPSAGATFCGVRREDADAEGDRFAHGFQPGFDPEHEAVADHVCPECMSVYREVMAE